MEWLESAQNAEKEEIDSTKSDLEEVAKPIMQKLYASAGGNTEGGGMPGGMPDMSGMPGGMPDMSNMPEMNPTVEEVD